jgi:hypothetical protein
VGTGDRAAGAWGWQLTSASRLRTRGVASPLLIRLHGVAHGSTQGQLYPFFYRKNIGAETLWTYHRTQRGSQWNSSGSVALCRSFPVWMEFNLLWSSWSVISTLPALPRIQNHTVARETWRLEVLIVATHTASFLPEFRNIPEHFRKRNHYVSFPLYFKFLAFEAGNSRNQLNKKQYTQLSETFSSYRTIHIFFFLRSAHQWRSYLELRRCIQKFPEWVGNEINNNNKHSLRSNTKGYGGKTH